MGERDFGGRACTYGDQYERSASALNCPWLASHDRHGVGRADWRPWADGPRHARPTRILCFRHCPRPARIGGCRGAASVRGDDGAIADRGSGPRPPRGWRSPPDAPSHVSPPGPTNGPFQCSGSGDRLLQVVQGELDRSTKWNAELHPSSVPGFEQGGLFQPKRGPVQGPTGLLHAAPGLRYVCRINRQFWIYG